MKRALTIIALLSPPSRWRTPRTDAADQAPAPGAVAGHARLRERGRHRHVRVAKRQRPLEIKRVAVAPDAYGYQVDDVGRRRSRPARTSTSG